MMPCTPRNLAASLAAATMLAGVPAAANAVDLTIATVNNSDMIIMQELSSQWEEATGNTLDWVVLEENVLRQRVTTDIATDGGQFDIITIGAYEAPIWGAQGWLVPLDDLGDGYDYEDIFEGVRNGLSADGTLYAVPFYAESSFTFYRTDLFEEAGLTMPEQPTWEEIASFAEELHDPENQVYGICLRGKPGWGENMAFVGTLVNTFGGRWFDMDWNPQLESDAWKEAINFYVDLLNNYGPPGASSNGHNENRALFASGNCAMWIDATSAAGYIFNPSESKVADVTSFAPAPVAETPNGAGWFWAWALAIPESSTKVDAAKDFLAWATSQEYVQLVGETKGWVSAPPGTRQSTYDIDAYVEAAPFAGFTKDAILTADPANPTAEPVPYTGIQFVAIPEFQGIGTQVGQMVAAALSGQMSVDQALASAQRSTERTMRQAGYLD
jgi:ABC-type glycerol-3-phosphate transport system substrate-binding protein